MRLRLSWYVCPCLLLLAWFGSSGCAMLAAQGAASAAMALGGATAMEMTANDMMPRQHEEMEAHLDAFFEQGPIVARNATAQARRPRLVDPEELLFQPVAPQRLGQFPATDDSVAKAQPEGLPAFPSRRPAKREAPAQQPAFPDPPPDGGSLLDQARAPLDTSREPARPSTTQSSYMKEYEQFFGVWPLEGASGPIESFEQATSDGQE